MNANKMRKPLLSKLDMMILAGVLAIVTRLASKTRLDEMLESGSYSFAHKKMSSFDK